MYIFPSVLTSLLTPVAEKHPHNAMLPLLCLEAGIVLMK